MDLDLTPEQELLAETVRGLCARHAGLDVVRQLEDDPVGYPEKFWLQLAELGLLDVSELTMLDATVVYFELGRALVPSPHFASSSPNSWAETLVLVKKAPISTPVEKRRVTWRVRPRSPARY